MKVQKKKKITEFIIILQHFTKINKHKQKLTDINNNFTNQKIRESNITSQNFTRIDKN